MGQGSPANAKDKRTREGKNHTKENGRHRIKDGLASKIKAAVPGLPEPE